MFIGRTSVRYTADKPGRVHLVGKLTETCWETEWRLFLLVLMATAGACGAAALCRVAG